MKNETAVEWLVSNMPNIGEYIPLGVTLEFQAKIEQAKAMEKKQIDNAWDRGYKQGYYDPEFEKENNETFKSE